MVEERKDIRQAIALMIKSEGCIKIEDILPFFPGFARIDDFKDEICQALDKYNTHIDELKQEMAEATLSSERIRRDMRDLGDRCFLPLGQGRYIMIGPPLLSHATESLLFV